MSEQIVIRPINADELSALLDLYTHLHATDAELPPPAVLQQVWNDILNDPKLHYLVADLHGALVASCTLAIIPNLTRGARPYGVIENVVTHALHRRQGIGRRLLHTALQIAWEWNCYKVMLLSGATREAAHHVYEEVGFRNDSKTGFVVTAEQEGVRAKDDA